MDLRSIALPHELTEIFDAVYKKLKTYDKELSESMLLEYIINQWLEPYERKESGEEMHRGKARLKNNLKQAIKLSGKTRIQLAREIGVNRVYLGQVVNGKCDPSITLALLLAKALNYPPGKIDELFYIEPVSE